MSTLAFIFLPDIPFSSEQKSKEQLVSALNQKCPAAKFDVSKIIISRKDNKHNAYAQTTQEHEQNLIDAKQIKIGQKVVSLKKCFPNHQIYINKLPDSFSKDQISNYFGQFGKISNIELFAAEGNYQNPKQKSNINHCYIRFENDKDAENCIFSENKHTISNKSNKVDIRVVRAYKIGQNDETDKKLFLKISPIVQFDAQILQKQLYTYLSQFGQLREKIRIQQLSNFASKSIITFTSIQSGQNALQKFKFNSKTQKFEKLEFVLRAFASKESYMAFIGGLKGHIKEEDIRKALLQYGKIVSCTVNPSKRQGIINAVVTFSDEQSFKSALIEYKTNKQFTELFAIKPYMDIHMSANLRNDYNNFKKKDKKPIDNNLVNMGGIGIGFGVPPRINQQIPQPYLGGNFGGNQQFFNPPIGLGMNPKIPPPPPQNANFRPPI